MYFSFIVCLVFFFFAFDNRMTLSFLRAFQYKDLARSRAHFGGSEENHQRAAWLCTVHLANTFDGTWTERRLLEKIVAVWWRSTSPAEDRRCLLKIVVACWRTPPTGEDRHCLVKIAAAWWRSRRRCRHLNQTALLPVCAFIRSQNLSIKRFSTAHLLFFNKSVGSFRPPSL